MLLLHHYEGKLAVLLPFRKLAIKINSSSIKLFALMCEKCSTSWQGQHLDAPSGVVVGIDQGGCRLELRAGRGVRRRSRAKRKRGICSHIDYRTINKLAHSSQPNTPFHERARSLTSPLTTMHAVLINPKSDSFDFLPPRAYRSVCLFDDL